MSGVLPVTSVSLGAVVVSFAGATGEDPTIVAALNMRFPAQVVARTHVIDVQMQASAAGAGLRSLPPMLPALRRVSSNLPAPIASSHQTLDVDGSRTGPGQAVTFEWLSRLTLAPGAYRLRFAVTDKTTGMAGSVFADVDVPDFTAGPVSLSGLVLATDPPPAMSGADALSTFIPVMPSTERAFASTDTATAFVRVYETGTSSAPATFGLRIITASGATAWEHPIPLGATTSGHARTFEVQTSLPLTTLTAGAYLLRATATAGPTTVTRDVPFRVK
jgi:hypothetical protein